MTQLNSLEYAAREIKRLVESARRSEIRLGANGGNSILVVCDPARDAEYSRHFEDSLPEETFKMIDLNKLLIDFVKDNKSEIIEDFSQLQTSFNEIFSSSHIFLAIESLSLIP